MGQTTTVADGANWKHEFVMTDKCTPSLQFEETQMDTGLSYKTLGVKCNTMTIGFEREGQVNAKFDLLGDFKYMNRSLVDMDSPLGITADAAINFKSY